MDGYINLLKNIYENGMEKPDRTDVGESKFLPGGYMQHDMSKGFPALTTRRVSLRIAFEETMFFLRGETDTKKLEEKKINIWKGNTSREFLDNAGLFHLPEGSLGTGYSHQWRNFGGELGNYGSGVDQIKNLLKGMIEDPTSRRHVVSAWNPAQLTNTPLPPCHIMHMYTVDPVNKLLHTSFVMRSSDVVFGLPYNLMSYGLLNKIFAKYCNLDSGMLSYFGNDSHIYKNQYDMVEEQISRKPTKLPDLKINKKIERFEDILDLEYKDIELDGYEPLPDIKDKPRMAT